MGNLSSIGMNAQRWILNKFALSRVNYWSTFVIDFSTAVFFVIWGIHYSPNHLWSVVTAFIAGIGSWTLTEYVFHRWIYHQPQLIFGEGHALHHEEDEMLIAMPWFISTLLMFALWTPITYVFGFSLFSPVLGGWLVGFVYYSLVHHSHHHWNLEIGWMRKLKAYHRVHHQFPNCNFGVTMRFWDIVFGTRYRRPTP
ncbi:MAG TPA: hypothetical protein DCQ83_07565 [Fibrobacteres bacterium]|jgi:4-hydroxysphinganine ceramide fatty acyl 2-hydroxylase|nr:hypothetical protein [Fibrobacterota bacterium]